MSAKKENIRVGIFILIVLGIAYGCRKLIEGGYWI